MTRFYSISLDGLFLTDNGTVDGTPCKLTVSGVDALFQTITGSVTPAADGTPIAQTFDFTKGKFIEIAVEVMPSAVWEDLKTLFNSALVNGDSIEVIGTGAPGNFTVDCLPQLPSPYAHESFLNNRIYGVRLRLITT